MAKPHIIVAGAATVSYACMWHVSKGGSSSRVIFILSSWLRDKLLISVYNKNILSVKFLLIASS